MEKTDTLQRALRMIAANKARKQSADHQGPHDFEGALMLLRYLREQAMVEGKSDSDVLDDAELMLEDPSHFKDEYAELQGREAPPTIDEDVSMAEPMPAIEETGPNANMPMPGPQAGPIAPMSSVRHSADNIATRCPNPKCKSGTTGVINSDGKKTTCQCHSCGKIFSVDSIVHDQIDSKSGKLAGDDPTEPKDDPELHVGDDDGPTSDDNLVVQWEDLRVGHEYKMIGRNADDEYWSAGPDVIMITGPGEEGSPVGDHFVYQIASDMNMSQKHEMTREEYEKESIELRSTDDGDDFDDPRTGPSEELHEADSSMYEGQPEQTDLSTPTRVGHIWGRFARGDEFMRPDELNKRPFFDRNDHGVPLIDAPYPNGFSSNERFAAAMEEWKHEYLYPALRHREARSLTDLIKRKIASAHPIDDAIWSRIEELGGPHYSNEDKHEEFEGDPLPGAQENWASWRMPNDEENSAVEEVFGDIADRLVGRGVVMQPEGSESILHSWPVHLADRADNPKAERFHGQHLMSVGWDPETSGRTATFNIKLGPDGHPIVESDGDVFPLTDEDIDLIKSFHNELAEERADVESEGRFGKTAGAEFNLMQQKEFIGEQGVARNSDKLDLSNTHYADNAMEDHFLFGLL